MFFETSRLVARRTLVTTRCCGLECSRAEIFDSRGFLSDVFYVLHNDFGLRLEDFVADV